MIKMNSMIFTLFLSIATTTFSVQAVADTQSAVKRTKYSEKYDRNCKPEKYTPKNATCNKEKMDSKYFIGAVSRIENEIKGRAAWETVADEVKELIGLGEKASAVLVALSQLGFNNDQINLILSQAGIDPTKVVVPAKLIIDKYNNKDDKKEHHHDVATNGGSSTDKDSYTVSCVKA